jgi:hypothetical protein
VDIESAGGCVVRFTYATELPIPDRTGATAEFSHNYTRSDISRRRVAFVSVPATKIGAGAAT